jgi:Tol biopolymer transport system component
MNSDGSNQEQLTTEPAPISSDNPAWSPDGTKIIFDTNRNQRVDILVMDADGSNQRVLISDLKLIPARASWGPVRK